MHIVKRPITDSYPTHREFPEEMGRPFLVWLTQPQRMYADCKPCKGTGIYSRQVEEPVNFLGLTIYSFEAGECPACGGTGIGGSAHGLN